MPIKVERDDKQHRGPACYRQRKDGGVTMMCPYGHLVRTIRRWAGSPEEEKAAWGEDIVTCHGKLAPEAEPYPFGDTFLGNHDR